MVITMVITQKLRYLNRLTPKSEETQLSKSSRFEPKMLATKKLDLFVLLQFILYIKPHYWLLPPLALKICFYLYVYK